MHQKRSGDRISFAKKLKSGFELRPLQVYQRGWMASFPALQGILHPLFSMIAAYELTFAAVANSSMYLDIIRKSEVNPFWVDSPFHHLVMFSKYSTKIIQNPLQSPQPSNVLLGLFGIPSVIIICPLFGSFKPPEWKSTNGNGWDIYYSHVTIELSS